MKNMQKKKLKSKKEGLYLLFYEKYIPLRWARALNLLHVFALGSESVLDMETWILAIIKSHIRLIVIQSRKSGNYMHLAVVVPVDEGWVEVAGPGLDHTGNVDGGALLYEPLLK